MNKLSFGLCALFLFGVYALPGKVCPVPEEGGRGAVSRTNLPPCHRSSTAPQAPCGKMVCCLLPDVSRGMGAVVDLPSPEFSGMIALPVSQDIFSSVVARRIPFEAQAPPGLSERFSFHPSPRGPPLA